MPVLGQKVADEDIEEEEEARVEVWEALVNPDTQDVVDADLDGETGALAK